MDRCAEKAERKCGAMRCGGMRCERRCFVIKVPTMRRMRSGASECMYRMNSEGVIRELRCIVC